MMFVPLLVLGLIFFLITRYYSFHGCGNHYTRHSGRNAVEILKERYARGEIDSAEYNQKKQELER
ncbi:MAG: SHOCT domain-containing protein [Desulfitobacterium hafniense]|nr:SHOCT domain-containing protein [Desulfitobacterium hafniense]